MRVLMIPYDTVNPYQQRFGLGLESCGMKVTYSPWSMRLPLTGPDAPDVLHVHWLWRAKKPLPMFLAWLPCFLLQVMSFRRRGGLLLWTIHNLSHHEGHYAEREHFVGRIMGRLADVVIVHSHSALQPAIERFGLRPDKVAVIPHPSYAVQEPGLTRAAARKRLGLPADGTLFALVGSIRPYKGVEELIEAHGKAANPTARLVIAGRPRDDAYGAHIAALAEEHPGVSLRLGLLDDQEIEALLAAADAVVLPYRAILTSGALVLAMGMGRACIAPRMGVFEEHLAGGGGILYNPGDVDGLTGALREAAEFPERLDACGARNLALVSAWSPEAVGAQTAKALRDART